MMDDELIKFKEVKKSFGRNVVLDNVSFSVPENKITGIIGASGEGKTTILKLLVGFYKPSKGEILYSKRNVLKEKDIKNIFGFATEDGSFHSRLTVAENLKHFGILHHVKRKDLNLRIEEMMKFVGLEYARDVISGNLSMGMKKRLDVAISLMHEPLVLIMDEPTADLDPLLRDKMLDLIKKIRDRGTTIILTTQILGEMDKICDKIVILFDKKIICEGSPPSIKRKYHAKDLDGVFNKIFSKRSEERTQVLVRKGGSILKKEKNREKENKGGKEKQKNLTDGQKYLVKKKIDKSVKK
jgi:ABC-2 type transport system ATP-binding protein